MPEWRRNRRWDLPAPRGDPWAPPPTGAPPAFRPGGGGRGPSARPASAAAANHHRPPPPPLPPRAADDRPLLVLDLNGVLLDRREARGAAGCVGNLPPDGAVGQRKVYVRPHAGSFLEWALAVFRVGVWTSAKLENARKLLGIVLRKCNAERQRMGGSGGGGGLHLGVFAFIWSNEQCSGEYPALRKDLRRLWEAGWGTPERTLLLDDDAYKAASCVDNAWQPPPFDAAVGAASGAQPDDALAEGGALRGVLLGAAQAASVPQYLRALRGSGGRAGQAAGQDTASAANAPAGAAPAAGGSREEQPGPFLARGEAGAGDGCTMPGSSSAREHGGGGGPRRKQQGAVPHTEAAVTRLRQELGALLSSRGRPPAEEEAASAAAGVAGAAAG